MANATHQSDWFWVGFVSGAGGLCRLTGVCDTAGVDSVCVTSYSATVPRIDAKGRQTLV
ncbi:hypothetical protein HLRTI_002763 [Halorhabdus tiamatea SARL4B]|uniref:Uncharacterized protein n=1 Tax=Halorhabdus tiamatea SARL4B TaxID=1033806 RepID=F7PI76_9EURY|nr:hypothetical protein HLRTI_002763 [Halorhabdus tiamatea SARL4B]CCQ32177.1 hypothetical protein HTIA_0025 [Halorhabdus tiamatea SARL4B]